MKIILNKYAFILVLFAAQITSFTACDVKNNNDVERMRKLFIICSATDGPCNVQIPTGPQTYKIIVFGSREPLTNQTIADFLNQQSDMIAVATNSDNCLTDSVLSNFNVAVDYDHNGMLPEPQDALKRFVTNGGRIIALHHSIFEPCVSMPVKHDSYGAYINIQSARGIDFQFVIV